MVNAGLLKTASRGQRLLVGGYVPRDSPRIVLLGDRCHDKLFQVGRLRGDVIE
jgi:hypothetical protein